MFPKLVAFDLEYVDHVKRGTYADTNSVKLYAVESMD